MKFSHTAQHTFRACALLLVVFSFFHYTLAQENQGESSIASTEEVTQVSEAVQPEVLGDSLDSLVSDQEEVTSVEAISEPEIVEPTPQEEIPVVVPETAENIEEEVSLLDRIRDIFTPDEEPEILEPVDETFEQFEEVLEPYPFIDPESLPSISAIPDVKEFTTDTDALHACWIDIFSVGMQFLPNKNNTVMVNHNQATGPATIEIVGIPTGFDIFFKENKQQSITVASSQNEVPFTIEKNGDTQDGSFNVTFVFTKGVTNPSVTTCQMNIEN